MTVVGKTRGSRIENHGYPVSSFVAVVQAKSWESFGVRSLKTASRSAKPLRAGQAVASAGVEPFQSRVIFVRPENRLPTSYDWYSPFFG